MNENLVLQPSDLTITKNAESCVLFSYPDPASPLGRELQAQGRWQGVLQGTPIPSNLSLLSGTPWTIFWGHTGPDVHAGMTGTQDEADAQLLLDMQVAEANVRKVVTIELTQEEFIALCDLAFNIGCGAFDTSTLLRLLNSGDTQGAIDQFKVWNKAGGEVLEGLVKRRDAEQALFTLGANYA